MAIQMPHQVKGPIYRLGEHVPVIDESAWIAPTAAVIGRVNVGAQSGIWFHCVLRGDVNDIEIGARTNIQDGTIIHVDPGEFRTVVGSDVTVGHACIIHGCRLADGAVVGMGATILNGCVVEEGGVLGAGSLLTSGKRVGTNELWTGAPATFRRVLKAGEREDFLANTGAYVRSARRFDRDLASL